MLHVYIDADACPVKPEIYRVAQRYELLVTVVSNSWMKVPTGKMIKLEVVGKDFDEVDDWIVDHAVTDDIVVTADIPLANRCIKEGAQVIGTSGKRFTEDSIGQTLATRDLLAELRGAGEITGGPPPLTQRDRSYFMQQLDVIIQSVRRKYPGVSDYTMIDNKAHWEKIYKKKSPEAVGWYEKVPLNSLRLVKNSGITLTDPIIDIGGGASVLVDNLLIAGYTNLSVLDISSGALKLSQDRLGEEAHKVKWIEADITEFDASRQYSLWHDRAAFHFLINLEERRKYVDALKRTVVSGGQAIVATFAIDGPTRCSGRDIVQYDAKKLSKVLGSDFEIVENFKATHIMPSKAEQKFEYFRLQKS